MWTWTWTMIHCVSHWSISHIPGEKSLSGSARWMAYWKRGECGGSGVHTSSSEVGQSLTDLTPLFLTARESSGGSRVSLRALRQSQQMAPTYGEMKAPESKDFSKSTKCCGVRLMTTCHTCSSVRGIRNLQLSNWVICKVKEPELMLFP